MTLPTMKLQRSGLPRLGSLLGPALLLLACGSDSGPSGPPTSPPEPTRAVEFRKVLEREIPRQPQSPNFPSGLAVTPDGRWLVSLGFSNGTVTLYDATTLEIVTGPVRKFPCMPSSTIFCGEGIFQRDTLLLGQAHAAAVTPDGSMAIVTHGRGTFPGIFGFALPSLELVWAPRTIGLSNSRPPRYIVRDRAGENYYVSAEEGDEVVRLTPDRFTATGGADAIFRGEFTITSIALTRDERELLVLHDSGRRLAVLTTPGLAPRLSVELPIKGNVVVPLKEGDRAIVVGGTGTSMSTLETSSVLPLMAVSVDLASGVVGSPRVLLDGFGGVNLADGNQWTEVGESTAILSTSVGAVTIDTETGSAAFHPPEDLQSEFAPCCDITRLPNRDRVVMADADFEDETPTLIVFDVDEKSTATTDQTEEGP